MSTAPEARRARERREWATREAIDALVQAVACLTDPSVEHRAQAFVLAGVAMVRISEADEDGQPALERSIAHLDAMKARAKEREERRA